MDRRTFLKMFGISAIAASQAKAKIQLLDVQKELEKASNAPDSLEGDLDKVLQSDIVPEPIEEKNVISDFVDHDDEYYTIDQKDRETLRKFIGDEIYAKRGLPKNSRRLLLYNPHTKESLNTVYYINGRYRNGEIRRINHFFRDYRQNKTISMDRDLIDLVASIQNSINPRKPLLLVSGYRTPRTNRMLRRRSRGVAKHSLHMKGLASDLAPSDGSRRTLMRIHRIAKSKRAGGVGLYRRSMFVHVDTGRVRYWG